MSRNKIGHWGRKEGEQLFLAEKLSRCDALRLGFEEGSQFKRLAK